MSKINQLNKYINYKNPETYLAIASNVLSSGRQQTIPSLANYLVWVFYEDSYRYSIPLARKEKARCLIAARKIQRSPIGNYIFAEYMKQGRLP